MPDEITYRYHPVFTDSPHPMLAAEEEHRDHAICEQGFADIIDGPLAHLPSADFSANAAWAVLAAISQNILRAVGARGRVAQGSWSCSWGCCSVRPSGGVRSPTRVAQRGRGPHLAGPGVDGAEGILTWSERKWQTFGVRELVDLRETR